MARLHVGAMFDNAVPVNENVNAALGEDFRRYSTSDGFLTGLREMECLSLVLVWSSQDGARFRSTRHLS